MAWSLVGVFSHAHAHVSIGWHCSLPVSLLKPEFPEGQRFKGWREALNEFDLSYPGRSH